MFTDAQLDKCEHFTDAQFYAAARNYKQGTKTKLRAFYKAHSVEMIAASLKEAVHSKRPPCDVSRWERDLTDTRRIQLIIHCLNSATKLSIPGISRGNNNSPSVESVSGINSLYLTNYSSSLNGIILLSRLVISMC